MNVKFYSLSSLPAANTAAGSFVNVTGTGADAGLWYCTGAAMIRLDNVAQDKAGEVKTATVDTATGIASFKNASGVEVFTLDLSAYIAAEVAKLTGSATIATATDGVVTIKAGVSETDGKIENAVGTDITLAKVATTGKATDITLDPSIGIGSDEKKANVQDAIGALVSAFDGLVTDTQTFISAEESRATEAETAISSALDTHVSDTTKHITAEERTAWANEVGAKKAAEAAQADATTAIANAATAQTAAETAQTAANTAISDAAKAQDTADVALAAASTEKGRAEGAELALASRVSALENSTATADAVAAEESRAKGAEAALSTRLDTLEGEGEGSVKKAAADAVAAVVASAPEDFDTLKEIADWIAADTTRAAELQTTVASNTSAIASNKSAIESEVSRAELAESSLAARISTLEANPAANITDTKINAWDAVAASKGDYDDHVADEDIHVTTDDKDRWDAKQDAFNNAAVLSGISADDVTAWNSAAEANHTHANAAVLSGISADNVTAWDVVAASKGAYDTHVSDSVSHITAEERTKWNAKQDAIAENTYDEYGAAEEVKTSVIGTTDDSADADTINGAKAYADDAVASALVWLTEWPA